MPLQSHFFCCFITWFINRCIKMFYVVNYYYFAKSYFKILLNNITNY